MSVEIADDLIAIRDPDIDPDAIMEQIRERVQQRRKEKGFDQRTFPSFGLAERPDAPSDRPYDTDLYYYLRLANDNFAQAETSVVLASSPATQLPIIGWLWSLVRREVHHLVIFYANRSVNHQVNVNRYLVSVLNRLTAVTQEQQQTIQELQQEIETLRARDGGR
ncbi:MAG: hypothetical protein H0T73_20515 [Ardenticatenales bacterium]|nr:hypothetical protein [Ardenticatenales bacterium]